MKRFPKRAHLKLSVMGVALGGIAAMALLSTVEASPTDRPSTLLGTALVFRPPSLPLKFPHNKHGGEDFKCVMCHKKAPSSSRASDSLLPKMAVCNDCHDGAAVPKGYGSRGKPNTKPCAKCHTKFDAKGIPALVQWQKPRITFSHQLHLGKKIACLTCHTGIDKAGPPNGKVHLPRMAKCMSCHSKRKVSTRCTTCHVRVPGGRMRTRFPEGSLKPSRSLPHLAHGPTFRKQHKNAARGYEKQCLQCHQKSSCLRCHAGVRKPASIHMGNYILRHGAEARANRKRCQSCHTRSRFCRDCHRKTGLSKKRDQLKSPYIVPGLKKFHGKNWASSAVRGTAANRHAVHARRNVGTCVACHTEKDCMTCHARRRRGGLGRNPHGPGFRHSRRCKTLLKKNRRSCLKCHGFRDPLMTLCR